MSTTIAQIVVVRGFWASSEASGRRHRPKDGSNGLKNHFLKKVIFLNFEVGRDLCEADRISPREAQNWIDRPPTLIRCLNAVSRAFVRHPDRGLSLLSSSPRRSPCMS